jgi:hypothetical protein
VIQKFGKSLKKIRKFALEKKIQNFWLKKRITTPDQKLEENWSGII